MGKMWEPWTGCYPISDGCKYCYLYGQNSKHHGQNEVSKTNDFYKPLETIYMPRKKLTKQKIASSDKNVYVCFNSDFFIKEADEWRFEAWSIMKQRRDLRIDLFLVSLPEDWGDGYNNVVIYCTVENQDMADYRLPLYVSYPIKHKGIVCSPLLSNINLAPYLFFSLFVSPHSGDMEVSMATWLTHLRVADAVRSSLDITDIPLYFVGSIAPDNEFESDISHLCKNGDKTTCNLKGFYHNHILKQSSNNLDFYLGYYVHLYTDVIWQKQLIKPLIAQDKDVKKLKLLWQNVDAQFLLENRDYYPLKMLAQANNINRKWFDYCDDLTVKNLRDKIIRLSGQQSLIEIDISAQNNISMFISMCADKILNNVVVLKHS